MYYRRKILLALIESFGGRLGKTDCMKLLILLCQTTKQNYYDFFPYKYGGFSFLVYQDKQRLTNLGYLQESEDFLLSKTNTSFLDQLAPKDNMVLNTLARKYKNLSGRELLHHVYLKYPNYTYKSEILNDILNSDEIKQINWLDIVDENRCLFTIGYEGLTVDAYLNKLILNNIKIVVDVRKNPNSMKYGFSKTKFQQYLCRVGIDYLHIPDLGIPSKLRQNLNHPQDYTNLFQFYQSEILPQQTEALHEITSILDQFSRVALTCFEADYHSCHRHKITQYLENLDSFNTKIVHLT